MLVLNAGSSSLKFALFENGEPLVKTFSGNIDRIGSTEATFTFKGNDDKTFVQDVMLAAPTTHFVSAAQAILYRGAGIDVVWPQLLALFAIGGVLFGASHARFRKSISQMA